MFTMLYILFILYSFYCWLVLCAGKGRESPLTINQKIPSTHRKTEWEGSVWKQNPSAYNRFLKIQSSWKSKNIPYNLPIQNTCVIIPELLYLLLGFQSNHLFLQKEPEAKAVTKTVLFAAPLSHISGKKKKIAWLQREVSLIIKLWVEQ